MKTNDEETFLEYMTLMRKLFETGELTPEEWELRHTLHQEIVDIGNKKAELIRRQKHLDDMIHKDAQRDENRTYRDTVRHMCNKSDDTLESDYDKYAQMFGW